MRLTFLLFILLCLCCQPKLHRQSAIIVVPLGEVSTQVVDSVQAFLGKAYGIAPQIITPVALPKHAFVTTKTPRYRADSLLVYLNEIRKCEEADFAFGITAVDISTTKRNKGGSIKEPHYKYADWGIMGLAYRPGRAAIVSTFRLNTNHHSFYTRLQKVSIHELGHNLGLPHCQNIQCVMTDAAESVKTIDHCLATFCTRCRQVLRN
jgi:archaemetzincin